MAHAVIGGLISLSLLTLVVVPVLLTLLEDMARRIGFKGRAGAPPPSEEHPPRNVLRAGE